MTLYDFLQQFVFPNFPEERVGLAILLLRLFVGVAFINRGGGKLGNIAGFQAQLTTAWSADWVPSGDTPKIITESPRQCARLFLSKRTFSV